MRGKATVFDWVLVGTVVIVSMYMLAQLMATQLVTKL